MLGGRRGGIAVVLALGTCAAGAALATRDQSVVVGEHADRVATRRSVTVLAGGEIITESAVRDAAAKAAAPGQRFDFTPLFAPLAPTLTAADLAICHIELPIGAPDQLPGNIGHSPFGGNRLLAPYELAAGLAASGFDRCSTASNHSDDAGATGIATTLAALDGAGVAHSGTARSAAEADARTVPFDVAGARVAHLSYTRGSNNVQLPDPWLVNYSPTAADVASDVRAARAAGAQIVIVSVHVLPEMSSQPAADDRAFVTKMTAAAPVDLVVAHGSHVVQPVELVNGAVVYWGLGNMLSGMGVAGTGPYVDQRTLDGLLAGVRFTETSPGSFQVQAWTVATCVDPATRRVWPGVAALAEPATPATVRPLLAACVARTRIVEPYTS